MSNPMRGMLVEAQPEDLAFGLGPNSSRFKLVRIGLQMSVN